MTTSPRARGDCDHCDASNVRTYQLDGRLCGRCHYAAQRRLGDCPRCGLHRLLPARRDREFCCSQCAHIDVYCHGCGARDRPLAGRDRCLACTNGVELRRQLCPDTEPAPHGVNLLAVLAQTHPFALQRMLREDGDLVDVLRCWVTGEADITHEHLDALGSSRRVEHLRQRLIVAGLLPTRDHRLWLFDRWLQEFVDTIPARHDRHIIERYAHWHHRRRILTAIDNDTLRASSIRGTRRTIRAATRFLDFLTQHRVDLHTCRQHDIDRWFANGPTTRHSALTFISWARTNRLCSAQLRLPDITSAIPTQMPHPQRVRLIARLLTDTDLDITDRAAGLLVALYAQPVTRITRLRRRDIVPAPTGIGLRVDNDTIALDEHSGELLRQLADTTPDPDQWLFPGTTPQQPVSAHGLSERLRRIGVTKAARIAALHELVANVPSPVLATLIGYNPTVLAQRADALGSDWHTYAALHHEPADHTNDHPDTPDDPAAVPPDPLPTARHG